MLHDQRYEWHWHHRTVPVVHPIMTFAPQGLVLGAGTVIVPTNGPREFQELHGQEARMLALLCAAYGNASAPSMLRNIERAVKAWSAGDDCLAYVHLAHTGLPRLRDIWAAAYRLELAHRAMEHGASPRAIFKALHLDPRYIDLVNKTYNPDQPRVPAGSGKTSGEWTSGEGTAEEETQGSSLLGRMPVPGSFLGALDATETAELGLYASRLLSPMTAAAVAAFGLLFIPSPNDVRVAGEVPEIPGLRYSWNRDETLLRVIYDDPEGGRSTFSAQLDDDVFRDAQGRVIGRVLPGGNVAIDAAAVSPDLADDDEPRFCPDPVKDRRTNDLGLEYENYIKSIVNPGNPTPPYMGYVLPNDAKVVSFDDCERSTGTMVEIKDGYAGFLKDEGGRELLAAMLLKQALNQIQAAGTRPIRWYSLKSK